MSAKINARAKTFQQTLVSAEADEAVDRWLIPLRQGRSAAGRTLQPTALVPPHGQPLGHFFATWREEARPGERRYFLAKTLSGGVHRRNVLGQPRARP